jgi:hypothetical protein
MQSFDGRGRINVYTCQACAGSIVTVDSDEGVTPMFLDCRAGGRCAGRMVSAGYRCDQSLPPTFEWYRPSLKAARRMGPAMLQHVEMGGLALRPAVAP